MQLAETFTRRQFSQGFLGIGLAVSLDQEPTTPTPTDVSPLQKTVIGESPTTPLESLPTFLRKEIYPDGDHYLFSSEIMFRPDEVITKDGISIFERIVLPVSSSSVDYADIGPFRNQYGQPDATIRGSSLYGEFETYYIYASRGLTIIGNPFTQWVSEINIYTPTTVDEYVAQYGQDINQRSEIKEEH